MLSWMLACDSEVPLPAAPEPAPAPIVRPDVVVITLDTARADRLGSYGHASAQTDTLDGLAAAGIRFSRAYSVLPLTIPAHATLFTGLFPFHHHIRDNGAGVLAESFTTMAELFQAQGYATAGSAAAFVTTRQWGLSQGFDAYFDEMPARVDQHTLGATNFWHTERSGDLVVDDALAWLASVPAEKPVMLWVHLYDAHFPYTPPEAYLAQVPGRPYDAELAFVDDQVARVVEAFRGRSTLFAVIGDHGEGLGEHGESEHGLFTYDATQRVPWILSGAGVAPAIVDTPVSSADFLPTVLRLAGVPIPEGLDGHAQPGGGTVPYAESYQMVDRFRIAPHRMVVDGRLKLIVKPKAELYDLAADPGEAHNLASERPEDVKRLSGLLDALNASPPSEGNAPVDAATLAQLQALGYMPGSSGGVDPFTLPDSLDFGPLLEGVDALSRSRSLSAKEAETKLDALLKMKPDAYELRMRKSRSLVKRERVDEARKFLEETAAMYPDDARPFVQLAGMAMEDGEPTRALEYTGRALDISPTDRLARELTVEAQLRAGLAEDAIAAGTVWFEEDPGNLGLAATLGRFWLFQRDPTRAEGYLRAATAGTSPRQGSRVQLAAVLVGTGRRGEAITELEAELGDYPSSVEARRSLSKLYADERDYLAQLAQVEELVRLQPGNVRALLDHAQCLFNMTDFPGARRVLNEALALAPDDADVVLLHANLLAKEGHSEEGAAVFARAKALDAARRAAAAGEAGAVPAPVSAPPPEVGGTGRPSGGSNTLASPKQKQP